MGLLRFFSSTAFCQNVNKSTLALLRKKTGYPIANIRKALEINENDATKAEEWLKEQAKALGWSAANKLQNRIVTQGLVGVAVDKKKIAIVELNCETDFVSRNEKFRTLVELVAKTCLQQPVLKPGEETNKVKFNSEEIGKLKAHDNSLADHLALLIGSVGENMVLKRGFCYETKRDDVNLAFAVHPPTENSAVCLGKYASFISYQVNSNETPSETENTLNQICRHIIGMSPTKVGELTEEDLDKMREESEKEENKERNEESLTAEEAMQTVDKVAEKENVPVEEKKKENELVRQEFLFDSSVKVGQVLKESGITILEFKRFECGEVEGEGDSATQEIVEKKVNAAMG